MTKFDSRMTHCTHQSLPLGRMQVRPGGGPVPATLLLVVSKYGILTFENTPGGVVNRTQRMQEERMRISAMQRSEVWRWCRSTRGGGYGGIRGLIRVKERWGRGRDLEGRSAAQTPHGHIASVDGRPFPRSNILPALHFIPFWAFAPRRPLSLEAAAAWSTDHVVLLSVALRHGFYAGPARMRSYRTAAQLPLP